MKLNKLLTPILGLATVSTVVAPLATSCTSETTDHVKISNKSEEVTCDSNGLATFLFVLDAHDYDVHGFKVSTTVDSKDTTGVVSSDFTTTWEIDGDHLIVKVLYDGGEEAPEDDVTIKLNIHINYGTEWNKTFDVKFDYAAAKATNLTIDKDSTYADFYSTVMPFDKGQSYTFVADLSTATSTQFNNGKPDLFKFNVDSVLTDKAYIAFQNVKIYKNKQLLTYGTDYGLAHLKVEGYYTTVGFYDSFLSSLTTNDTMTFVFEKMNIFIVDRSSETGYSEVDSVNGHAVYWAD